MSSVDRDWLVNGRQRRVRFAPLARLLDVLRDELGLTGVKEGCSEGECGTCSVLVDGEVVLACLTSAVQLEDGAEVMTVEGLGQHELGRALQSAFEEHGAVQCGYCTPGMLLGSYALLTARAGAPTEEAVRRALAGHLCRCTGYTKIVEAVMAAAHGDARAR